jgi:hypothetical protein
MIVEKQMECTSRLVGETEVLGENLPQRHFFRFAAVGSRRLTEAVLLLVYFCAFMRYFFIDCAESEGVHFAGIKVQIWVSELAKKPLGRRILLYCSNGYTVNCGIPW